MKTVFEEIMVECACGRRYMRITQPQTFVGSGSERCRCERMLGEWSGPQHYVFEPETEGPDAAPTYN